MAQANALKELARQVRDGTLQVLNAASAVRLTWTPPGTSNSILWHAGHTLWVQDRLCVELLSGQSELPADDIHWRMQMQLARVFELLQPIKRWAQTSSLLRRDPMTTVWTTKTATCFVERKCKMYHYNR